MKEIIKKLRAKIYRQLRKEYDYVFIRFFVKKYQIQIKIDAYVKMGAYSKVPQKKFFKSGTHYITTVKGKTIENRINNLLSRLIFYFNWNFKLNKY